jgi:electron transfer flavoprotein alpha subunit
MADILVFCEVVDGKLKGTARELLGKAKELADGDDVTALILGSDLGDAADGLGALGADAVLKVEHDALASYVPGAWAAAFSQAVEDNNPDVVIGAATSLGKDLLPRAAALLETGVATDVVDLFEGDDGIAGTRSLYSGKALATANVTSEPKFFSVRPNSFVIDGVEAGDGEVEDFDAELDDDYGYSVTDVESSGGDAIELTEANRIISGGRSLKSAENFGIFDEAAGLLGAAVGASRAAVDAGYAGHSMQVGQTGKVVNPQLYIACGISGAIQHLAGMRTSKVIVAINKDAEAPIFQHSTYGIVGDLFEVVPLLTEELKQVLAD